MRISTRTKNNGHVTVFPSNMCIYLHSQCLMATFQYFSWSSCSVQSLVVPTRRMVFCGYKSTTVQGSLWMSLQPWRKSWKAVLVLSSLKTCAYMVASCACTLNVTQIKPYKYKHQLPSLQSCSTSYILTNNSSWQYHLVWLHCIRIMYSQFSYDIAHIFGSGSVLIVL